MSTCHRGCRVKTSTVPYIDALLAVPGLDKGAIRSHGDDISKFTIDVAQCERARLAGSGGDHDDRAVIFRRANHLVRVRRRNRSCSSRPTSMRRSFRSSSIARRSSCFKAKSHPPETAKTPHVVGCATALELRSAARKDHEAITQEYRGKCYCAPVSAGPERRRRTCGSTAIATARALATR